MSWRRIGLLTFVFVALLGLGTWLLLQRSDAATLLVRRELQAMLKPQFEVDATSIDLAAGRLTATGLRLADPTRSGGQLLAIDRATVDVGFGGSSAIVAVHAVAVDGFSLEGGPVWPTAENLLAPSPKRAGGPAAIPALALHRGRVRATLRSGDEPIEWGDVEVRAAPKPDQPDVLLLRGGATLLALGARIEWDGEVATATGAARITLRTAGTRWSTATLARVARWLDFSPPDLDVGADLAQLTAIIEVPPSGPGAAGPSASVVAEFRDLHASGAGLPNLITAATVRREATTRDGGKAKVHLQQSTPRGTLDVLANAAPLTAETCLEIRANGSDIAVDADVLAALRLFAVGADIVDALRPTAGRADLELFLRNPQRRGGISELDLDLRDGAMAFYGFGAGEDRPAFPLPLQQARGRVQLRDDVVLLQGLAATVADGVGGGTVRVEGRVDTTQSSGEDTTIDVHGENIAFSPDLERALTTLLDDGGELYGKFAPSGRATVDVMLRPRRELRGGYAVEVRPAAATMRWAGFPYRLDGVTGMVRVDVDGAAFDLAGNHGPGSLSMRGYIPLGLASADGPGFSAAVELRALALDAELGTAVAALAPDLASAWRASTPSGSISGQVQVWRNDEGSPLCHDSRLTLSGVALQLPADPWRAIDLQGQLQIQGLGDRTRVDFDALRGRLDHGKGEPASLAMLGNLVRGEHSSEDLAFVVRDLELDETLGATLATLGALDRDTWSSLRPSGRIDLVCRHRGEGPRSEPLHVVVHLVDVRSDAPILPRPAEHMTGELTITGGEVRFQDVRGLLGGAPVRCSNGRIFERQPPDHRTELAFTVDCRGLPIDDGVANLFSGPLHRAVLQRQLLGTADLDALRLRFLLPAPGSTSPLETMLAGQLRLYDLDMTLGEGPDSTGVTGINGVATLAESLVSDVGGQLRGALSGVSLHMFGQPFEAIDATFTADAERIAITDLVARCHGGAVRSGQARTGIEYLLPAPATPLGRLRTDLAFEKVSVATFLDHGGWKNPPYSGEASGTLVIDALDGSDVINAVGRGALQIDRADLGQVPLFTAIYAQLPAADRPRFDGLSTTFSVGQRRVSFADLVVRSSLLSAMGKGSMAFDGYVEIELTLANLLGQSADPLVMPLIDYLAKNIVSFDLYGYLRDLHAEKRWVTESAPRRRPVLPMPPASPRPLAPSF